MANAKPSRVHRVVLTVTFDKPCNKGEATSIVRDCVSGDFYPSTNTVGQPEQFRVTRVQQITGG